VLREDGSLRLSVTNTRPGPRWRLWEVDREGLPSIAIYAKERATLDDVRKAIARNL